MSDEKPSVGEEVALNVIENMFAARRAVIPMELAIAGKFGERRDAYTNGAPLGRIAGLALDRGLNIDDIDALTLMDLATVVLKDIRKIQDDYRARL